MKTLITCSQNAKWTLMWHMRLRFCGSRIAIEHRTRVRESERNRRREHDENGANQNGRRTDSTPNSAKNLGRSIFVRETAHTTSESGSTARLRASLDRSSAACSSSCNFHHSNGKRNHRRLLSHRRTKAHLRRTNFGAGSGGAVIRVKGA